MSSRRGRRAPSAFRRRLNEWVHTVKWAALRWLYRRDIADVRLKLGAEPFAPILDHYPEVPLKVVRPYLTVGLKRGKRAVALVGHYMAAARLLCDAALVESHTGGLELFAVTTPAGTITVELTGQGGLYREAEWRLVLCLDHRPITEMGLAIVDRSLLRIEEAGEILLIGALKGVSAGAQGLEDARILTNAMEGMRPKTVLLFVAQVLSRSLGLSGLFAVSNAGHVFATDYSLRRRISADYDGFWIESGGLRTDPSMFAMPIAKAQRELTEYKSNKRARVRRRWRLEDQITDQVKASVQPLLRK
ncbi:DUF535 family protein [Mesorhizobium sp. M2C.T.Ca.TU.002.02.1.1]|uniref:DUF535 family protein n=1 Tax=Mesorhizobium sp. M2C.T.Ca.TU.002.02.1.1 TaxID=2496788 RepID=UPI000FCA74B2|nr:DUF535 family protein [Mesorhizobium sp. M2C.T.Ca.TU.002.02.1.1]RUU53368.1 DUF535 domain-containing protein [Mesorhizobium sp. M2C.T.Ca.TU.002.02.1.1]RUU69619.1 DUF535 domain-containing protein [Mesorhizobium sp. M2C.T.Ca.TU.009.01.2.1]